MEYGKLKEDEKVGLKARHRVERDRRICDRIKAVLMYDDGHSLEDIGKVLLLSREGIRKHLIDYHRQAKLNTANGGNYCKLTSAQEETLIKHLASHNYINAKDVGVYIEKHYGVSYTLTGVIKALHRLGFTYKKPKFMPTKSEDSGVQPRQPSKQRRTGFGWIRKSKKNKTTSKPYILIC